MITSVTEKNMVTIPAEVRRRLGIKPGSKLEWQPVEGRKEILVRVIPCRGELALQLLEAPAADFRPIATLSPSSWRNEQQTTS